MKGQLEIDLNGVIYRPGSKCPACSSENDKGGRMELKVRKRPFLKCNRCGYSILHKKTKASKERFMSRRNKQIL